jgi:hypothetical protein
MLCRSWCACPSLSSAGPVSTSIDHRGADLLALLALSVCAAALKRANMAAFLLAGENQAKSYFGPVIPQYSPRWEVTVCLFQQTSGTHTPKSLTPQHPSRFGYTQRSIFGARARAPEFSASRPALSISEQWRRVSPGLGATDKKAQYPDLTTDAIPRESVAAS